MRIADIKRITELTNGEIQNKLNEHDNTEKTKQMIEQKKADIAKMETREE